MRARLFQKKEYRKYTAASVFFVLLLLSFIYWNTHSNGVLVDAVIEIGQGGLHRKYSTNNDFDLSLSPNDGAYLYLPLETGADLMTTLDIRYQFDRDNMPRLISRIRKTQHRQYSRVIILTVEGDNERVALDYMGDIIKNVIERHDRIFVKRARYTREYVDQVQVAMNEQINGCVKPDQRDLQSKASLLRVANGKSCHVKNMVKQILLSSRIDYITSGVNFFRSSILLKPTVR